VDEAPFEEWLLAERERVRERAIEALARLLAHQMKHDLAAEAIQTAVRLVAVDPLQEAVHRTLMRLYVRQGRRASALHQYQLCVGALQRELSVEPELETRELYQRILQREHERAPAADVRPTGPAPGSPAAVGAGRPSDLAPSPLVGRGAERARFDDALRVTSTGTGQVFMVLGEAGIGKSRLVEHLAADAVDQGHRVLRAGSHETEQVLPLRPWVDALRESRIAAELEPLGGLSAPWRRELGRLFPELGDPALGLAGSPAEYVRLFEAVAALLGEVARRQPVTIVLDDLHWADDMSLRLFSFLGHRIGRQPILLARTVRDEEIGERPVLHALLEEFGRQPSWGRLTLLPLSRLETSALVASLAPASSSGAAVEQLAARVWGASEGNPFVITETMRALQERPGADADPVALPPRVRDLIRSRLGRLSDTARQVCETAAAIGEEFTFALLPDVTGLAEPASARALEELVRRNVLVAVGERFHFVHDRIREVVYEGLLIPTRRSLHARVAQAMERRDRDTPEEVDDRLAFHFARAEEPARALHYLLRLADKAARRYALEEAARVLRDAFGHVDRLPSGERDRRHLDVLYRLAHVLTMLARPAEARDLLAVWGPRIEQLADPTLSGPYHFWSAHLYGMAGDPHEAERAGRRAVEEAARCGDDVTAGKARAVLAREYYSLGRALEGIAHGRQAAALLEGAGEPWWLATAHWGVAQNHVQLGEFEPALEAIRRMEAIAEALGDGHLQTLAINWTARIHALVGDGETAIALARRSIEIVPDPLLQGMTRGHLGMCYWENGDAAAAIPLLQESLDRSRPGSGFRFITNIVMLRSMLAECHVLTADLDAADAHARKALEASTGHPWTVARAYSERAMGRVRWARGDLDGAERHLTRALDLFASVDTRFQVARMHLLLAELRVARGERDAAARHLEAARSAFVRLRVPRYVERADVLARKLGLAPDHGSG
jgi:tetratricopeptide (TPR) repeat protein